MNACILSTNLNALGYDVNWRDIVRPEILKVYKYKCSECGLSNHTKYTYENGNRVILDDDWLLNKYKDTGFKISCIHLSISHQCHTKSCINTQHLVTRCQSCHLRYDKHQH